jgi:hypothetical protein
MKSDYEVNPLKYTQKERSVKFTLRGFLYNYHIFAAIIFSNTF